MLADLGCARKKEAREGERAGNYSLRRSGSRPFSISAPLSKSERELERRCRKRLRESALSREFTQETLKRRPRSPTLDSRPGNDSRENVALLTC